MVLLVEGYTPWGELGLMACTASGTTMVQSNVRNGRLRRGRVVNRQRAPQPKQPVSLWPPFKPIQLSAKHLWLT